MKICCAINYDKLSSESSKHLARNTKFPTRAAVQALISQQSKLKNYLQKDNTNPRVLVHPPPKQDKQPKESQSDDSEQIVLHANYKLDLTKENEKLKAQLQGIQWRVLELEKACKEMQAQMTKAMTKNKTSSSSASRSSLPRLCSWSPNIPVSAPTKVKQQSDWVPANAFKGENERSTGWSNELSILYSCWCLPMSNWATFCMTSLEDLTETGVWIKRQAILLDGGAAEWLWILNGLLVLIHAEADERWSTSFT